MQPGHTLNRKKWQEFNDDFHISNAKFNILHDRPDKLFYSFRVGKKGMLKLCKELTEKWPKVYSFLKWFLAVKKETLLLQLVGCAPSSSML